MSGGKRNVISLVVTTEEAREIKEQAKKRGMSISSYCREKVLKEPKILEELQEIKEQIKKIAEQIEIKEVKL